MTAQQLVREEIICEMGGEGIQARSERKRKQLKADVDEDYVPASPEPSGLSFGTQSPKGASPEQIELLALLTSFDLDYEDFTLLRAEGIKSISDFHFVQNLDDLKLPAGALILLLYVHSFLSISLTVECALFLDALQ